MILPAVILNNSPQANSVFFGLRPPLLYRQSPPPPLGLLPATNRIDPDPLAWGPASSPIPRTFRPSPFNTSNVKKPYAYSKHCAPNPSNLTKTIPQNSRNAGEFQPQNLRQKNQAPGPQGPSLRPGGIALKAFRSQLLHLPWEHQEEVLHLPIGEKRTRSMWKSNIRRLESSRIEDLISSWNWAQVAFIHFPYFFHDKPSTLDMSSKKISIPCRLQFRPRYSHAGIAESLPSLRGFQWEDPSKLIEKPWENGDFSNKKWGLTGSISDVWLLSWCVTRWTMIYVVHMIYRVVNI